VKIASPWKAADDADRGAAFRGCHAGIRADIPAQPKRQRGGDVLSAHRSQKLRSNQKNGLERAYYGCIERTKVSV